MVPLTLAGSPHPDIDEDSHMAGLLGDCEASKETEEDLEQEVHEEPQRRAVTQNKQDTIFQISTRLTPPAGKIF